MFSVLGLLKKSGDDISISFCFGFLVDEVEELAEVHFLFGITVGEKREDFGF